MTFEPQYLNNHEEYLTGIVKRSFTILLQRKWYYRYSFGQWGKDSRRILWIAYSSHSLISQQVCVCVCEVTVRRSILKESLLCCSNMLQQYNTAVKMTARPFQVWRVVFEKLIILLKKCTHITITLVQQYSLSIRAIKRKLWHLYVIEILKTVKMTARPF